MKKAVWFLVLLFLPYQIMAYSNELIIDPKPIGIEVHSQGIYIISFYSVNGKNIAKEAGFQEGDRILEVNEEKINSIQDLEKIMKKAGTYQIKIMREDKEQILELQTIMENGIIKTGLYVKDQINGIGTLSYIDPETKVFASLGHDIVESTTNQPFQLKNGFIYQVKMNHIKKSTKESIGQINAKFTDQFLGTIKQNNINGIYGIYEKELSDNKKIEIASNKEIKKGKAYILLNLDGKEEYYDINILSIDEFSLNKNILFEITNKELLEQTGGIIQGMSGSPMIQNNKIIGIVNYVIVGTPEKGYGIFIEKMLEEGDKLIQ